MNIIKPLLAVMLTLPLFNVLSPCRAGEPISPDRPDFTESAQTLGAGQVQIEAGMTFDRSATVRTRTVGETLVRVAAGERAELRFGLPTYTTVSDGGRTSGLDDMFVEAKIRLNSSKSQTGLALLPSTTLPTGSSRVAENRYQPALILAADFPNFGKYSLSGNIGAGSKVNGGQRFGQVWGSLSLGREITEKTGSFFEVYAFNRDTAGGASRKYFDTGLSYLINADFQVDARVGLGLDNGDGPDYFYGFGASRRF